MSSPLWMSIEPDLEEVRLLLSEPLSGTVLKARLCCPPAHPRSVFMLLEALAAWYRSPLHAVCVADAAGIRENPERWAQLLAEPSGMDVRVEWVARPIPNRRRDRCLEGLGEFSTARRVLNRAATGQL